MPSKKKKNDLTHYHPTAKQLVLASLRSLQETKHTRHTSIPPRTDEHRATDEELGVAGPSGDVDAPRWAFSCSERYSAFHFAAEW